MSENYRPRHSLDSRYSNYDADFDLFEDRVVEPYSSSDASSADPAAQTDAAAERNPYLDEPEENYGAREGAPEDGILDADFEPIDEHAGENADERATSLGAGAATGLGAGAGLSAAAVTVDRRPLNLAKDSGAGVEEAGVGETGTAAAAGGATDEDVFGNGGQPADPDTKGVPLRGLVMILAAVGILLIGWGSYMLLSGDDKQETVASENNAGDNGEQNAPGDNAGAADRPGGNGADKPGAEAGRPGEVNKPGENGDGRDGRDNPEANRDEKPDNAPAGQIDPEHEYIAVLNNSQVSGLAGDVAKKIRGGEFKSTGYGNLPTGRFPESVVLYPSNNQPAREAAEKLARDLGIAAQERTPEIDDNLAGAEMFEGGKPAQIVVVTTNSMPQ
ncbi:LytR family transcriptional regulator [Corynebacterium sp. 320]|uniref:LytR C-terminal domain-containing protein n=1 Tax=Corynebacterium TaxID=1716 RepID=UPI00125CACBF|nr:MULTISPECIES: LytR C-terminal domain-containing protein [Corynebacterium]KAB1503076.1 LytR family transcriptional regulator [Corynebacterium sp. 320]KAB1550713.1 LytR family transcriptional regulator [Corynebacterium sp. 321]KAB1551072.1 LytR family transcriptional regulator [Corynebacterium sp. 319]KAB3526873.1 LytR family transcriptional regulator [Corynebacterium sp. 250]KAB3538366.1 LytR family transcriptional regulator [Corynebacterium sp. 366]